MTDTAEPMETDAPISASKGDNPTANEAATPSAVDSESKDPAPPDKATGAGGVQEGEPTQAAKKRTATEAAARDKAEAGSTAAAKPKKAKVATGSASLTGVRTYLETTVVPLLMTALQELATQKPEDPLTWLGDFLKDNAAKGNQDAADAAKKREATAATKAANAAAAAVSGKAASKDAPAVSKPPVEGSEPAPTERAAAAAAGDGKAATGDVKASTPDSTSAQPGAAKASVPKSKLGAGASPAAGGAITAAAAAAEADPESGPPPVPAS